MMTVTQTAIKFVTNTSDLVLPPKTIKNAVDAFLLLHAGRLAPTYRQWLEHRLKSLVLFLGESAPLESVQIWQLELWFADLSNRDALFESHQHRETIHGRGLSPETLHGYVRAVRTFWNWLGKHRYITSNPAALLQPPPLPELPARSPSPGEIKKLLAYAKKNSKRNYAALRLMQATGIRAGGFEGLTVRDINLSERWVFVKEKGKGGSGKSRYVPFDKKTADCLRDYFKNDRPKKAPTDKFFVADNGKRGLTARALYQVLRRYCQALDLPQISLHMLRHFFGTQSVANGVPSRVLQDLMGHKYGSTTERYTKFNPVRLHDFYDKAYTSETDIERMAQRKNGA